jgi:hypothetical protein
MEGRDGAAEEDGEAGHVALPLDGEHGTLRGGANAGMVRGNSGFWSPPPRVWGVVKEKGKRK